MRVCPEPGCPVLVEKGRCPKHPFRQNIHQQPYASARIGGRPRFVVTGPPGSGKSTLVKQQAQPGDLVWDLDEIAGVMAYAGALPEGMKGHLPWPVMKASLVMRDALVEWLSVTELTCSVFVIVSDPEEAQRIAGAIGAAVQRGPLAGAPPDRPTYYEARKDEPHIKLYRTEKWKQLSRKRLIDHPWCVGFPKGVHGAVSVLAECTDHIKPAHLFPDLFFLPENLQSLCFACNTRKGNSGE